MTSLYDDLKALGFVFEPAPRANPTGSLYAPYRLRDLYTQRVVMRGESRDDLEEKISRSSWMSALRYQFHQSTK